MVGSLGGKVVILNLLFGVQMGLLFLYESPFSFTPSRDTTAHERKYVQRRFFEAPRGQNHDMKSMSTVQYMEGGRGLLTKIGYELEEVDTRTVKMKRRGKNKEGNVQIHTHRTQQNRQTPVF